MRNFELFEKFEQLMPASMSCEWDNDGMMCSAGLSRVTKRVMLTLDITSDAVDHAISGAFDAVVSHHPLIFKPLKSLTSDRLMKLVRADITAMSFHTRLDAVDGGVNDVLADVLQLTNVQKVGEFIRVGEYDETMTFDAFILLVKRTLGCTAVNVAKRHNTVQRVAVLGGDGKDYYSEAAGCHADVYLTGAMSYNTMLDALEADNGPSVVEAEHFHTENPVLYKLADIIKTFDSEVYTEVFNSDPLAYL